MQVGTKAWTFYRSERNSAATICATLCPLESDMICHICCLHPQNHILYTVYLIKKKNATSERVNFPVPPLLEISEVPTESTWSTRGGTSVHHWNRPHHWAPVDVWMSKNKLPINMPRHHIIPNFNVPTKKRSWLDHSSNNIKDTRKRHQTMSRLKKLLTPRFRASQPCVKLILSRQSTNILDCHLQKMYTTWLTFRQIYRPSEPPFLGDLQFRSQNLTFWKRFGTNRYKK